MVMARYPSLAAINRRIAKVAPDTELVRGEGYYYLVFDDGNRYETHSIMTAYLRNQTPEVWVKDAVDFRSEFGR